MATALKHSHIIATAYSHSAATQPQFSHKHCKLATALHHSPQHCLTPTALQASHSIATALQSGYSSSQAGVQEMNLPPLLLAVARSTCACWQRYIAPCWLPLGMKTRMRLSLPSIFSACFTALSGVKAFLTSLGTWPHPSISLWSCRKSSTAGTRYYQQIMGSLLLQLCTALAHFWCTVCYS